MLQLSIPSTTRAGNLRHDSGPGSVRGLGEFQSDRRDLQPGHRFSDSLKQVSEQTEQRTQQPAEASMESIRDQRRTAHSDGNSQNAQASASKDSKAERQPRADAEGGTVEQDTGDAQSVSDASPDVQQDAQPAAPTGESQEPGTGAQHQQSSPQTDLEETETFQDNSSATESALRAGASAVAASDVEQAASDRSRESTARQSAPVMPQRSADGEGSASKLMHTENSSESVESTSRERASATASSAASPVPSATPVSQGQSQAPASHGSGANSAGVQIANQQTGADVSSAGNQSDGAQDSEQEQSSSQRAKTQLPEGERDQRSFRLNPASMRARNVEQALQVEQVTGRSPATGVDQVVRLGDIDVSARVANTGSTATNGPSTISSAFQADMPDQQNLFTSRLVRGLTSMVNQRGGVMSMRLDPPQLGSLRVQMTMQQSTVNATFQVTTPQAQAMLQQHMTTLQTALESAGLTVDKLSVQMSGPSGQSATHHQNSDGNQNDQQRQSHDQQHDAGGEQSRGRHDHHAQSESNLAQHHRSSNGINGRGVSFTDRINTILGIAAR